MLGREEAERLEYADDLASFDTVRQSAQDAGVLALVHELPHQEEVPQVSLSPASLASLQLLQPRVHTFALALVLVFHSPARKKVRNCLVGG